MNCFELKDMIKYIYKSISSICMEVCFLHGFKKNTISFSCNFVEIIRYDLQEKKGLGNINYTFYEKYMNCEIKSLNYLFFFVFCDEKKPELSEQSEFYINILRIQNSMAETGFSYIYICHVRRK